ncbi:6-phosphogluconate dehydrogenase nad-binding [Paramyrothecium foliicola]|nr:6-phosphogluconate dehydrogenase nad-binding [Paramyrothecium foliicola]
MHTVTIIGIGNIGAAMVKAWLDAGFAVTMWNRNPDRPVLRELEAKGAVYQENMALSVAASDTLIICVSTYDNINSLFSGVLPMDTIASPKRIINLTTGTSQQARKMGSWFKDNGVLAYFDGAIMVTPELVGTEHSTLYISGESRAAFEDAEAALKPLGNPYYVSEDTGAASLWDVAALTAMSGMWTAAFSAMSLLKRQRASSGGETPTVAKPMQQIVLPLLTVFLPHIVDIAHALDEEKWEENFGNSASMQLKGTETILQCLREEGVSTEGLDLFHRLLKQTIQDKGPDAGLAAMGMYLLKRL